jgi:hypothetical protein
MEENKTCYSFKKLSFDQGIFDKSLDATYILHLEGNGRYEHVIKQINKYPTTQTVYILMNPGFKKCKKTLPMQSSIFDLIDANLHTMKHANELNYKNILIFEDDFMFSKKMSDTSHHKNINDFCSTKINDEFMYFLGSVPILILPYNTYTWRGIATGATHAVIYSRGMRDKMLSIPDNTIADWDMYIAKRLNYYKYIYSEPLVNQLFVETENKSNWAYDQPEYTRKTILFFLNTSIYLLGLDKPETVENGFNLMYLLAKLFVLFLTLLVIFLVYLVLKTLIPFKYLVKYAKKRKA